MKLLVTGGCGFIGANLVRHILAERPEIRVVNLDLLTYAGNPENLGDVVERHGDGTSDGGSTRGSAAVTPDCSGTGTGTSDRSAAVTPDRSGTGTPGSSARSPVRYRFVHGDICDGSLVREVMADADAVLHLAAESHVDRSIADGAPFVRTNVVGTHVLLAAALETGVDRFVQVSTDEVYGELPWRDPAEEDTSSALRRFRARRESSGNRAAPADEGAAATPRFFTEDTPLAPRSPYSATKAAGDHLALSYHTTHGMDVVVTRSSNNYGPYQFPEKLIPLMITRCLQGRELPLYGDGLHVRDWIHVEDHCRGLLAALDSGRAGRVYNFGGDAERKNRDVVRAIVEATGTDAALITSVPDRPGHDRRYAIDASRASEELDWSPRTSFVDGLRDTVRWYREHETWWKRVETGAYREGLPA